MPIPIAGAPDQLEARIEEIVRELTFDEKVAMLSGHGFLEQITADTGRYCARLYHIGAGNERLGIPPLLFMDGPRGIGMGNSTCFPVSMARGASFDVDLERRIGDAIGRELRAHGGNLFGGVCINLLRHPAWGRAQETYGEDPFLLGEMGVALMRGVQHHNIVATVKHYACNSMENARFSVDVQIDERALREVYLPHFLKCVGAGIGAVMSAYNRVNGTYCGHNRELLTRILKEEWGFDGFVYSDFILGCRGPDAAAAGLDVEAPDTIHFGDKLRNAVRQGEVSEERIDDAIARVLRSLLRTRFAVDPEQYGARAIACTKHVELAREAADKSIVLLRNQGVLPFDGSSLGRLLVLGVLAERPNLGDHGSSRVFPPEVITPLSGLRGACPEGCEVVYDPGEDLERVRSLAADADAVLVVAGYTHEDEGEYIPVQVGDTSGMAYGGDRTDLTLGEKQEALISAAAEVTPNTVVAVMSGSAVIMEAWRQRVAAILMLWYPGMQGGAALADILFGRVNPSGRLPLTIPKHVEDLPYFDRDAEEVTYDLWHGYTRLERAGIAPAFPFGFGLSYSDFELGTPVVRFDPDNERLRVTIDLHNVGHRAGATVLQVYVGCDESGIEQAVKKLCGFSRVSLQANAHKTTTVDVALRDIAIFDVEARCWRVTAGSWNVWTGSSSASADLTRVPITLPQLTWPVGTPLLP